MDYNIVLIIYKSYYYKYGGEKRIINFPLKSGHQKKLTHVIYTYYRGIRHIK